MAKPSTIVRGYNIEPDQDTVVREYARRRCGGNTSLAIRTIINHFKYCPEAANVEPLIPDLQADPNLEQAIA